MTPFGIIAALSVALLLLVVLLAKLWAWSDQESEALEQYRAELDRQREEAIQRMIQRCRQ